MATFRKRGCLVKRHQLDIIGATESRVGGSVALKITTRHTWWQFSRPAEIPVPGMMSGGTALQDAARRRLSRWWTMGQAVSPGRHGGARRLVA